jgi:hypothetical protein
MDNQEVIKNRQSRGNQEWTINRQETTLDTRCRTKQTNKKCNTRNNKDEETPTKTWGSTWVFMKGK